MSAKDCITAKATAGKVDPKKAARLAELFDEQAAELERLNHPDPSGEAALRTRRILAHENALKKRLRLRQMKVQGEVRARIADGQDPLNAALAILDFDPTRRERGASVKQVADGIRGQALGIMADFVERFGSRYAGLDDAVPAAKRAKVAGQREIVRELFGEASGNDTAKAVAAGVAEAFEHLRATFNAVGGHIPKLEKWGLPQTHSRRKLAAEGKDAWLDHILPRLDRARMVDGDTGQPFLEEKLRRSLSDVYDQIVTDGLIEVTPGYRAGRNVVRKRAEHRFLVFRDAGSWLEYHERFGDGSVFEVAVGHVNGMARDIATVKMLGPNPAATVQYMEALVGELQGKKALAAAGTGKKAARLAGRVSVQQPAIRDLYDAVTGAIHTPAANGMTLANISAMNRNVNVAAKLGGAWFSALTDPAFMAATAAATGLRYAPMIGRLLKLFNPLSEADRRLARRLGFTNEILLGSAIGASRYVGEVVGPEWSRKVADVTMRAFTLSPWTQAGTDAVRMETLGRVTEMASRRFDDIEPDLRDAMRAYGITADDWDLMRRTPLWRDAATGAEFLRPQDIAGGAADAGPLFERRFDAAMKLMTMVEAESEMGVPKATARMTAALYGGSRPGQGRREVAANLLLFKAFPLSILWTHVRRLALADIRGANKAKMAAHLVIGGFVLGTLGEQLSQISKGRDPLPMDPTSEEGRKTWMKGLHRGGGMGIFGDFVFADQNRFGGGFAETVAGPVGSEIGDFSKLTIGNLQELAMEGEAKRPGRELVDFARSMTPGRSGWYLSLAFDRLLFDTAQQALDPDHAASFRRVENRAYREFNQKYWSPPGSSLPPKRGPDLARALE